MNISFAHSFNRGVKCISYASKCCRLFFSLSPSFCASLVCEWIVDITHKHTEPVFRCRRRVLLTLRERSAVCVSIVSLRAISNDREIVIHTRTQTHKHSHTVCVCAPMCWCANWLNGSVAWRGDGDDDNDDDATTLAHKHTRHNLFIGLNYENSLTLAINTQHGERCNVRASITIIVWIVRAQSIIDMCVHNFRTPTAHKPHWLDYRRLSACAPNDQQRRHQLRMTTQSLVAHFPFRDRAQHTLHIAFRSARISHVCEYHTFIYGMNGRCCWTNEQQQRQQQLYRIVLCVLRNVHSVARKCGCVCAMFE